MSDCDPSMMNQLSPSSIGEDVEITDISLYLKKINIEKIRISSHILVLVYLHLGTSQYLHIGTLYFFTVRSSHMDDPYFF
jgi:hypothetical protein